MTVMADTITGAGDASNAYTAAAGNFSVMVYGRFSGKVALERSVDAGVTWVPVARSNGEPVVFDKPGAYVFTEVEAATYRARLDAFFSGTVSVRMAP